jgi:hypothetical protein
MLFRVVLAVAVLAIYVYGLVDVIRTDGRLTRGISKPAWIVVVIFLPLIGTILWLLMGRPRGTSPALLKYSHPTSPDDDPDFLRNLEVRRRNQAEAARLKKLTDELEAKSKADGGPAGAGPDGSRPDGSRPDGSSKSPSGKVGLDGGTASEASPGEADTHDTDDRK